MRNDHGADGNGTLDGLCSEQHVRDGQRAVYDLQSVAGRCACGVDRRERCCHLLALCALLGIVGAVVDVPTAIAAFVCTSLFICLLFSQRLSRGNVVAAVSGAVSVAVCKFLGLVNIAVPASVVVGIAIALACDAVFDGRGARDAR